jgi:hypothetical protein
LWVEKKKKEKGKKEGKKGLRKKKTVGAANQGAKFNVI